MSENEAVENLSKKVEHQVQVNKVEGGETYHLKYGNFDRVTVVIGNDGFSFAWEQNKAKTAEEIFAPTFQLTRHIIARCSLILWLKNKVPLKINSITCSVNGVIGKVVPLDVSFSVAPKRKARLCKLPYDKLLLLTQIKNANELASINAYVLSKATDNIYEKFLYLWMATNGVYSYLYGGNNDTNSIASFATKLSNVECKTVSKTERPKLAGIFSKYYTNEDFSEDAKNTFDNYTFYQLVLETAYYFRCNYFHSNIPIPLCSFNDEEKVKKFKVLCSKLERIIDNNLNKLFENPKPQHKNTQNTKPHKEVKTHSSN